MSERSEAIASHKMERVAQQELVTLRDGILRLQDNADFRLVINKEYIERETVRAAHGAADPRLDAKMQADLLSMAVAGGHLRRFMSMHIQAGDMAEKQIAQIDANLEELEMLSDADYETGEE